MPEIAAVAAERGIVRPTGARRERFFELGEFEPSETSAGAVFRTSDGRVLAVALRGGGVEVELR
ncbi:hypothetical protein DAT35_53955 [Vitiosangium sp. GDMCC 1.1324]|nr:hypothetical protein DAT35_53955 [Vitiosangium sp. GDMCC 1.1324]